VVEGHYLSPLVSQTGTPLPVPVPFGAGTARMQTPRAPPLFNQGLPDVTGGPVDLNPLLKYPGGTQPQRGWTVLGIPDGNGHACVPATDPPISSMTIIMPNTRPVTVHSLPNNHGVTVGDVLRVLDAAILAKGTSTLQLPQPPPLRDRNGAERCPCERDSTVIDWLRRRYARAGLTSSGQGTGTWNLRIK